jgi:hypothetical protein
VIRKLIVIAAFALLCSGGVALAGQNSNSSTTMEPKHEMSMGRMGRRHRRHRRMWHRRHRHEMKMHNKNANM